MDLEYHQTSVSYHVCTNHNFLQAEVMTGNHTRSFVGIVQSRVAVVTESVCFHQFESCLLSTSILHQGSMIRTELAS